MKYSSGLAKKEREQIFKLFLDKVSLKFNEIEKAIKIRSNMIAYHLEKMIAEDILVKDGEHYCLTKTAEKYIPIVTHVTGEKMSPLPVMLVAVINKNQILLIKRNKRPYQGYWSMIGGKINLEESFEEASKRIVKEKTALDTEFISMNSVLHERVADENVIKHSFIHFFVKMNANETKVKISERGELKWFKISSVEKEKIIPSDLWLIKNKLSSKIAVKSALMTDTHGELSSFKILP